MFTELNSYIPGVHNYYYDISTGDGEYRGYAVSIPEAVQEANSWASLAIYPHIELYYLNGNLIRSWDLQ